MGKIYNWFDERLELQAIADDVSSKYVPPHVNIFYCIGGITFTCFLVQVATGFAMTFYYRPTVAEAFASVQYIMTDVNFGWLIRSIHLTAHICKQYQTPQVLSGDRDSFFACWHISENDEDSSLA